jgi:large subunit ribosomal protein L20
MIRVKRGIITKRRRKKILKIASGYFGSRHRLFRIAKESVQRALYYSYRDRKVRKRFFRRLWILRINAFTREHGLKYSLFICKLHKMNCILNRKVLASLSIFQPETMKQIIKNSLIYDN